MTTYPKTFELPTTDKLTGLLGFDYFRHLLREELLPQARTSGDPLSLFLMDLNGFGLLYDKYGVRCADQVVVDVARIMQRTLPETAVLCRYGVDEFSAALPNTRLDDAFTLVEELRRQIAAFRWEECGEMQATVGIGLAAFPTNAANDVELIREADQAMYVAKNTGGNKVSLPLADSRMITKTSYYTQTQLERLSQLAKTVKTNEATLLREGLDDLLKKYNDRLESLPRG